MAIDDMLSFGPVDRKPPASRVEGLPGPVPAIMAGAVLGG